MHRLFLISSVLIITGCAGPHPARITTYDQICLPKESIELQAKVEADSFFHQKLKNKKVSFFLKNKLIGESNTNHRGMASFPFTPPATGVFHIKVQIDSEQDKAAASTLLVFAAQPETKFLVVDIDNTISNLSPLLMLFTENIDIPPMKGAPETLQALSKNHTIIYITGRDDSLTNKTKDWLKEKGFPEGPVFFWDLFRTPASKQKYKSQLIGQLGRKFQLIQIGIGNSVGDALAYLANGLETFILLGQEEKNRVSRLPRGVRIVNSWEEIQQFLY